VDLTPAEVYDFYLIGFQTARDRRNFVKCLRIFVRDIEIEGRGHVLAAHTPERTARIGNFPISIDVNASRCQVVVPSREDVPQYKRPRNWIRELDVFWWVDSFLRAAITKDFSNCPRPHGTPWEDALDYQLPS